MRKEGLEYAGAFVANGRLHRFRPGEDKRPNGWYVLHAGPPAAGAFGCWKRGIKIPAWCEKDPKDYTEAQWREIQEGWRKAAIEREKADRIRHAAAGKIAERILTRAGPATGNGYLERKGVNGHGELRQWGDELVVPLRDAEGKLQSLQFIAPDKRFGEDGEKRDKTFLRDGQTAGAFFTLCERTDGPLLICEGYATGASVHEATAYATVCAMNCGNLKAVAQSMRAKRPERDIIIAADNDQFTAGNPGMAKAEQAAKTIHGRLAVPQFTDVTKKPTDFNDLHQLEGIHTVKNQIGSARPPVETEWPQPKPLPADLPEVLPFNFDCLPHTLKDWIEDIADRMQCPPDFPAVGAVIALGSLVGRKIGIRPKRYDDWLVIPNLWGGVVGRPGVMKTPALEQPLLPLRRLVAEATEKYEAAMRGHDVNTMLHSQKVKLAEKRVAAHLKKGDEQAARAEATATLKKEGEEPLCRRYETNDPTIERLGVLLKENPTGLLLFRDELVGFLRGLDREGHESDRAVYLELWNGTGSFTSDRIQRGTISTPAVLSLLGGIQPDLLTSYVREAVRGGEGADGLLQRIQLFVWPDVSKSWSNIDRWPDAEAKNRAFEVFKYLDDLKPEAVGADTSSGIPFLRFAHDAQVAFDSWRAELEKKLRSDLEHPAFEAHLSKYRKLVPALALLIHLANRDVGPVSLDALKKAFLWARYLEAHARRIYSAVLRPDTAAARELAKHLERGDLPARFTLRESYRKGWAGLSDKEDAEAATEILLEMGWIRLIADNGRVCGRPASPTFETNPKIHDAQRSALPEPTKPPSVSIVSEIGREAETFMAGKQALPEPHKAAEVCLEL